MTRSDLINAVIIRMKLDIAEGDLTAIEILLDNLTTNDLESYLPVGYIDPRYLDDNKNLEEEL
jgi:hypothetical protein